jgi:hypothetical protein
MKSIASKIDSIVDKNSEGFGEKTIFTEKHQQQVTAELTRLVTIVRAALPKSDDPHGLYDIAYEVLK